MNNVTKIESQHQKVPVDLQISEMRYRRLFESTGDGILILDAANRKITEANPFMVELLGYSRAEFLGKELWEIGLLKDEQFSKAAFRELKEQGHIRYEDLPLETKEGVRREIEFISNTYVEGDRQVIQCNIRDITQRKRAEEAHRKSENVIRESEQRYRLLVDGVKDYAIFMLDAQGRVTSWNPGAERIKGYRAEEIIGEHFSRFYPAEDIESDKPSRELKAAVAEGRYEEEGWRIRKDGTRFFANVVITALLDESGALRGFSKVTHDITERKRAKDSLKKSLEEKDLLLKETHHRVKNNLQVVSSLMNLQSRFLKNKQAIEMFRDSQNRIHSMALVHELLYQSKDLAKIDIAAYIQSLVSDLLSSHGTRAQPIYTGIEIEPFQIDIDMAIPCGLIINELVSNTLKHAFPDDRERRIKISLRLEGDQNMVLSVSDNGIGLPPEIDIQRTKTLGLQLVTNLCRQLRGKLEIHNNNGTEFKVVFPAPITSDGYIYVNSNKE